MKPRWYRGRFTLKVDTIPEPFIDNHEHHVISDDPRDAVQRIRTLAEAAVDGWFELGVNRDEIERSKIEITDMGQAEDA